MNGYVTVKDMAKRWNVSERQVQVWCKSGRVDGVLQFGRSWALPDATEKPTRTVRMKPGRKTTQKNSEAL